MGTQERNGQGEKEVLLMIALFSKKKNHYAILYKHPNPLFSFIQTLTFLCLAKVVTCRFNIRFQLFIPSGVLEYVNSLSAYIFFIAVYFFFGGKTITRPRYFGID